VTSLEDIHSIKGEVHSYEAREDFAKISKRNIEIWGAKNVQVTLGKLQEVSLPSNFYDGIVLVSFFELKYFLLQNYC
jgi:tRNA A58 N-methylase Trm61